MLYRYDNKYRRARIHSFIYFNLIYRTGTGIVLIPCIWPPLPSTVPAPQAAVGVGVGVGKPVQGLPRRGAGQRPGSEGVG